MNYEVVEEHYRANYSRLVKRFTRYYSDKSRAEDVVQEAYARACTYINKFNPAQDFNRWFTTILNNAGKNNSKEELRHGAVDYEELPETAAPEAIIPKVIYNQVVERINSKEESICDILRYSLVDHLPVSDVVKLTNQNANTIRWIVHEFRKEIKKDFKWAI